MPAKFEEIAKTASKPKASWSNCDLLRFHYFNPNGAYAHHCEAYDDLLEAVKADLLPGGALIAYDGDYHRSRMADMVRNRTRVSRFEATYHAEQLIETAAKIRAKLAEVQ